MVSSRHLTHLFFIIFFLRRISLSEAQSITELNDELKIYQNVSKDNVVEMQLVQTVQLNSVTFFSNVSDSVIVIYFKFIYQFALFCSL